MIANRILYILSFVACLVLFLFTGSSIALALMLVLGVLALVLAIGVAIESSYTKLEVAVPRSFEVGGDARIQIDVVRGLPFSLALVVFDVECESLVFRSAERRRVALALDSTRRSHASIPFEAGRYGRLRVRIANSICADPLGLFTRKLPLACGEQCVAYPEDYALTTNVRSVPLSRAFGKTYDERRSGSDVDEVFNVREFREGDHLASIHWKLSARFDTMMSREFSRPVDFEMIVVTLGSLRGRENERIDSSVLNGVALTGIAISRDFLDLNLSHNYALPVNGVLASELVDSLDSYAHATELVLDAPLSQTYSDAVSVLMASELATNFTKCILVTSVYDEMLWSQLAIEMNLSVVLLVKGQGVNEVEGEYDLIVIDTEDAQDHERCINL